ncbi:MULTISPECIES: hypothetical protein [Paracoccus]|uniref:hypothetical protein n=1 Tax=Paracoccus TaxID=265 RepID=UPI0003B5A586|nr:MULTISPECIES: hypothetical protein [Paracoccus]
MREPRAILRRFASRCQNAAEGGDPEEPAGAKLMNSIIYIVGLVVIVLFILSFLGLR